MKKKINNLFTLLSIVALSSCQSYLWTTYYPVQSNLIGRPVNRFSSSTKEIALNPFEGIPVELVTSESASISKEEFSKKLQIKLGKILSNKVESKIKIEAKNIKKDIIKNLKNVNPDAQFVISGLRADTVRIISTKTDSMKASITEFAKLIPQIKAALNTLGIPDLSIQNFDKSKKEIVITNNKVYYLIQIAKYKSNLGTREKWYKSFNLEQMGVENKPVKLKPNTEEYKTEKLWVEYTGLFSRKNRLKPEVWLSVEKTNTSDLKLILHHSSTMQCCQDDTTTILPNRLGGTAWDYSRCYVYDFPLSNKRYKVIYLWLDAYKMANNEGIIINEAYIKYPEAILEYKPFCTK